MTFLDKYLDDGANWQAQAVLAYMRRMREDILSSTWNKEYLRYAGTIEVGRYENGREQGYVFAIGYKGKYRNYAVYEHKNSDSLMVLIHNGVSLNTPNFDFMHRENAYTENTFNYGSILPCGDFIIKDMKEFLDTINNKFNNKN